MKLRDSQVLSTLDFPLKDSVIATFMITSSITKGWHWKEAIYSISRMSSKKTLVQWCGRTWFMRYLIINRKVKYRNNVGQWSSEYLNCLNFLQNFLVFPYRN